MKPKRIKEVIMTLMRWRYKKITRICKILCLIILIKISR
jgi:hypothetical protein